LSIVLSIALPLIDISPTTFFISKFSPGASRIWIQILKKQDYLWIILPIALQLLDISSINLYLNGILANFS
jgi:hypothetical protein